MSGHGMEPLLRSSLERAARAAARETSPDALSAARERLLDGLERRRAARRAVAAGGVLAAALVAAVAVVGLPAGAPPTPVGATSSVSPEPAASLLSAPPPASDTPRGDPVPALAQGHWAARVVVEGQPTRATVTLSSARYDLCTGPAECLTGSVTRQGDTLVFFDEQWCGRDGEDGAGRYVWRVSGDRLALVRRGPDPCYRSPVLGDADWVRD